MKYLGYVFAITTTIAFIIMLVGIVTSPDPTKPIRDNLQEQGYTLVKAKMESPAVTISLTTKAELITQATTLNTTTIYDTSNGFVVLDTTQNIGYELNLILQHTWFGLPWYSPVIAVIPIAVVGVVWVKYEEA